MPAYFFEKDVDRFVVCCKMSLLYWCILSWLLVAWTEFYPEIIPQEVSANTTFTKILGVISAFLCIVSIVEFSCDRDRGYFKQKPFRPKECILISGFPFSGKDAAGAWFRRQSPNNNADSHNHYSIFAFADMLKQEASAHAHVPLEWFYDRQWKDHFQTELGKTPRQFVIEFAAQKRKQDPNYFTRRVCEQVEKNQASFVVITDFRYIYEQEFIRKRWGLTNLTACWMDRPGCSLGTDVQTISKANMDFVIHNDGHLVDLYDTLRSVLDVIHSDRKRF